MSQRWIGLARVRRDVCAKRLGMRIRTAGASAALLMAAAAVNFATFPDALAAVIGGESAIVGFVPEEPSGMSASTIKPVIVDESEVRLLAATAWAEARSEGEAGMRAVAHVIMNRVGDRFGASVESVILAPAQFSAWNLGDPNRLLAQNPERYAAKSDINTLTWETAQRVAREVLSGQSIDPTEGALFYHTSAIRPWWSRFGEGRRTVGAHVFYSDVPDQRPRGRVLQAADNTPRYIDGVRLDPSPAAPDPVAPPALSSAELGPGEVMVGPLAQNSASP
jgi:Cell Wall Hydrolase